MKNILFFFISFILTITAYGQCTQFSCVKPCTGVTNVQAHVQGNLLIVSYDHISSASSCSFGIVPYVNGVPYLESGMMPWGTDMSGGIVPGYVVTPGESICVVVRNHCSYPQSCIDAIKYESDPVCITAPPGSVPACRCNPNNNKYVISKSGEMNRCVTKNKCLQMLSQGWTSACNCN